MKPSYPLNGYQYTCTWKDVFILKQSPDGSAMLFCRQDSGRILWVCVVAISGAMVVISFDLAWLHSGQCNFSPAKTDTTRLRLPDAGRQANSYSSSEGLLQNYITVGLLSTEKCYSYRRVSARKMQLQYSMFAMELHLSCTNPSIYWRFHVKLSYLCGALKGRKIPLVYRGFSEKLYHHTSKFSVHFVEVSRCFWNNKANLRDLIAATGLVILLKLD